MGMIQSARDLLPNREIGYYGQEVHAGIAFTEDTNTKFSSVQDSVKIYDEMHTKSAKVSISTRLLAAPSLQCDFWVDPGGETAQDQKIAEWTKKLFIEGKTDLFNKSWNVKTLIRDMYLSQVYGFFTFEKNVTLNDKNQYYYKTISPRFPTTVQYFEKDPQTGELTGIRQFIQKGTNFVTTDLIPCEKLFHVAYQPGCSAWSGRSIIRPGHFHYETCKNLWLIDRIAAERGAMGIPCFKEPESGPRPGDIGRVRIAASNLRANSKLYMIIPWGWEFWMENSVERAKSTFESILYHDRMISVSMGTEYVDLGSGRSTGAKNLGETKMNSFFMIQQADLDFFVYMINEHLVKEIVDLEFSPQRYPKINCSSILNHFNTESFTDFVTRCASVGMLTPDDNTEDYLRRYRRMPIMDRNDMRRRHVQETHLEPHDPKDAIDSKAAPQ